MNEDLKTDERPRAPIHFEHWCEHEGCKKWGGFGFARSKSEPSVWKCWEHFEQKETLRGAV